MRFQLNGLIAAVHSPFDTNGDLDLGAVEAQANRLLATGVHAAFVCGTTGECSSLTTPERLALQDAWTRATRGTPLHVVAHVGSACLAEAKTLSRAAQENGACAISAVAPSYLKPASLADLMDFMAKVSASAPELPFFYYDIPQLTGVSFSMPGLLDHARAKIPRLAGIKYSNADMPQLLECLLHSDKAFNILFGIDEALLGALAMGVQGAVGSSYNFAAPIYNRLIMAFQKGDMATARTEQIQSVRLIRLLSRYGYMAAAKHLMALLGAPVGSVRPPLKELDTTSKSSLERELHESGLWTAIQA